MKKNTGGQTLIELLIALAVFAITSMAFLSSLVNLMSAHVRYRQQNQAVQYAREGLEITYNLAVNSNDWNEFLNLASNSHPYHPTSSGSLGLEENSETISSIFTRSIILENEDNNIKATALVEWQQQGKAQQVELSTYLIDFSSI